MGPSLNGDESIDPTSVPDERLMNKPTIYPKGITCRVDIEEADMEAARFYSALRDARRADSLSAGARSHGEPGRPRWG
jgi:hypothetical protein